MAVECQGDAWVMEQLGEKQDFESQLTRLGFRHEDFKLCVRRARQISTSAVWASYYAVRVCNVETGRRNIYWGGPKENWVGQFVTDLAQGLYGGPTLRRPPTRHLAVVRDPGADGR